LKEKLDCWLTQFAEGSITYMELLELLGTCVVEHPDQASSIIGALQAHPDPYVQEVRMWLTRTFPDLCRTTKEN
jgi:hypothetical protein